MPDQEQKPRVGVGVMVFRNEKLLLGKRKGSHGAGQFATPGGHLEYMESFEACAKREVKEETGMEITDIKFLCLVNLKEYAPKHYVHIALTAQWVEGEPKVLEPEKCEGWDWYDLGNLPKPLFGTYSQQLEALETRKVFFDK
jgi:8-oxo-dGTP diphosphatase